MNIIEATLTARPIRRKGWKHWLSGPEDYSYALTFEDVTAHDWEAAPEKEIVVTKSMMKDAWRRVGAKWHKAMELFAEELGL